MLIELKTDLLLVKHWQISIAGELTGNHIYELWMIPAATPELKERIHYFTGAQAGCRAECEKAVDQLTCQLVKEGLRLPVLWAEADEEIHVVKE